MFSVAVSGGCGGGGSGRYYGDYGQDRNSSQDVTPVPESQDVTPENPVSNDQYGDENGDEDYGVDGKGQNSFARLNNTEWVISRIHILTDKDLPAMCKIVEGTYNYSADKVRFRVEGDMFTWYDSNNHHHVDQLTINVTDPTGSTTVAAPLIASGVGFKYSDAADFDNYTLRIDEYEDEYFDFQKNALSNGLSIQIRNHFDINHVKYFSVVTLEPYVNEVNISEDVRYLGMLADTEWKIEKLSVYSVKDEIRECPISANSYNYPANKLKFWTDVDNEGKYNYEDAMIWYDGNGDIHSQSNHLTVECEDPTDPNGTAKFRATILRTASNFKRVLSSGDIENCQASFGNEGSETISIAKNLETVIVENHFYVDTVHYMSCMELSRSTEWPSYLVKLNNTEWVISKLTVNCHDDTSSDLFNDIECNIVDNSYNVRSYNTTADKTFFFMTNENTFTWFDNQYLNRPRPLTVDVIYPTTKTTIKMPILKSIRNVKSGTRNAKQEVYKSTLDVLNRVPNVLTEGIEEITIFRDDFGEPINKLTITNRAFLGSLNFLARLELVPYKPNN